MSVASEGTTLHEMVIFALLSSHSLSKYGSIICFSIIIWYPKKWFLNQKYGFPKNGFPKYDFSIKKWYSQKMVSQNMISQSKNGIPKYGFLNHNVVSLKYSSIIKWEDTLVTTYFSIL